MPLFSRRPRDEAAVASAQGHHARQQHVRGEPLTMQHKPSFGQWIKGTWKDILTMALMGALGLGVYMAPPAPNRSFAVTFQDGEIVYPQFAYPMRKEVVPIWLAAFLAAMIPIVMILLMQIRVRSFWDANNGIIGLLYSLITAAVFQVFIKCLIGGLRPHFLDACQPDFNLLNNPAIAGQGYNSKGFGQIYFTREICTGDPKEINDSLESMPSGHTTAAFAGFVYLYLYLNAKLKVFSNYHPSMWKLILIYAPILGACLIGGALTIDEYHNWYDILAGAIIGTIMAFSSYRMVYAAIWDYRFNHVPLSRGNAFGMGESWNSDAVATRKAGWGGYGEHGFGHHGHGNGYGHGLGGHHKEAVHPDGMASSALPRKPIGTHGHHGGDNIV